MSLLRPLTLFAVVAVTALGVAACGDDDEGDATTAASETTSQEASVSFVDPMDGATTEDTVAAEVDLQGFEIDTEQVGKASEEGHGHLHFSLDGGEYDYPKYSGANGELAKQLGVEGQYSPATEPTITYENLPPGEHTLEVSLANNDHSDAGVTASTTFTVG
jgi:hypothetical protein